MVEVRMVLEDGAFFATIENTDRVWRGVVVDDGPPGPAKVKGRLISAADVSYGEAKRRCEDFRAGWLLGKRE